mgnify:CR=1 FL=1
MRPWLFLLLWPSFVWADDILVCNPAHPLVPQAVVQYERQADSSPYRANPNALIWEAPHEAMTPARLSEVTQLRASLDGLLVGGVLSRYWKCQPPIVVEMTSTEKTVLDAPAVAEQARQQAFTDEIATSDICDVNLDQINGRVNAWVNARQADLDGTITAAQFKTVMRDQVIPQMGAFMQKISRCLRATRR